MSTRRSRFSVLLTTIAAFLLPFSFVQELPYFSADENPGPTPTVTRHFAPQGTILANKSAAGFLSIADRIKDRFAGSLIVTPTAQHCLSICGHAILAYLPYCGTPSEFRCISDRSPPYAFSLKA
jgi:hypothetical protein